MGFSWKWLDPIAYNNTNKSNNTINNNNNSNVKDISGDLKRLWLAHIRTHPHSKFQALLL
jgi:hypothetical protein